MDEYDFVVVGGGSAGYAAARTAAELGMRVAVIEGGKEVGGLCILRGCMPSKALIESGNRILAMRRAEEFGLKAEFLSRNVTKVRDRKRRLIADFAGYREGQLTDGRFEFVRGMARFVDPTTVEVDLSEGGLRTICGRTFLVCTGSTVRRVPIPGLEDAGYLISDDILDASELPESLIVLGGGAIAAELAHYAEAMGVKVTLVQRNTQLLTGTDADLARAVEVAFHKRGIELWLGTELLRVERGGVNGKKKRVVFRHEGEEQAAEGEEILQALGRRPAIDGLDLDAAGVASEGGFVRTRPTQATNVPEIFAAGDVCGQYEIVHIAVQQGEVAARNAARLLGILGGEPEEMDYTLKLFGIFTEPQVGTVGLSETELKKSGRAYRVASYPFDDHGKSMVMGGTDGFVKLMADSESGKLLGGAAVGPQCTELIHQVVVAMAAGMTAAQFAKVPQYHPTLSEIWSYPAEELAGASSTGAEGGNGNRSSP